MDVRGPLAHHVGVRSLETGAELSRHLGEGPLDVDAVPSHPIENRLEIRLVRRDEAVRLDDRRELLSDVAGRLARVPAELFRG
jgi:hypothetical protein